MKNPLRYALLATMMSAITQQALAQENTSVNTKTIREMSGATAVTSLSASKTALIVIDIQNEYFTGKMVIPDGMQALNNSKKLVNFAHQKGMPVFFVQHVGAKNDPLFAEGSVYAEFHKDLLPGANDITVKKATPSAFVGTSLDAQLKKRGINQLVVTGLMTHMCVSSTARDAVPLGYSVIIPEDATATRDLNDWQGGVVDHRVLQRAALTAVADVFAEISTTERVLALPVEP
ncbi:cysteine hydrolase family protein [Yokenella regensburgei]|uniref:Isochorismatase family protein yecD n=1 Tax=Yokenella regensburgei TaxID=158877 RepID=A0AB38FRI8_9ENTR|nr:cysteine hydrolase family protein [Yokenella regensburgei]KFD20424.1 isochorismatase [Yokenella regensburgei ATCC 49455]SQA60771.1 Isochorismatase family protein yecD [Yokenella regensburgei]SQA67149.1 Isochorismatase family protein yecD [Yokenella regensburgei]SUQ05593.1 Isochorismatase family protein yecD [Yokenella regensburgei]